MIFSLIIRYAIFIVNIAYCFPIIYIGKNNACIGFEKPDPFDKTTGIPGSRNLPFFVISGTDKGTSIISLL